MELPILFSNCKDPCASICFRHRRIDLQNTRNPKFARFVVSVVAEPQQHRAKSIRDKLLEELAGRYIAPRKYKEFLPKTYILKPPLSDQKLAQRLLSSPQLTLTSFPLLSSCLPFRPLTSEDQLWINDFILEAKQALGYPLEPSNHYVDENDAPGKQFDTLLYLAFQYPACERSKLLHVRTGHYRLAFLGEYVLELALAEYILQRYPRERTGAIRERVFGMIGKMNLPKCIRAASLQNLVFPYDDMYSLEKDHRERVAKSVFSAIFGAIYVCFGIAEVYRVLAEAFRIHPDGEDCQPKERRHLPDVDYVSDELECKPITWQDVAFYKVPDGALFRHPRLFRACVPPGIHRFRGNYWDCANRPQVMQMLGYPLQIQQDEIREMTEARNIELGLGIQLCYMHSSINSVEHPRFSFDRLEYLGRKIQDLVMAERLVMKHIDASRSWLRKTHLQRITNKNCAKHLREKNLQSFIVYSNRLQDSFRVNRHLRNSATTSVQLALHGLGYTVYGKREVRRLMFDVFDYEENHPVLIS